MEQWNPLEFQLNKMREKRNELLNETDFRALPDYPDRDKKWLICGATKLNTSIVPLPKKFRKPVRIREFNVGSNGIFFFASRFDAVELRSSPRLLATALNTNCQVRLRGLWAMADALCAES